MCYVFLFNRHQQIFRQGAGLQVIEIVCGLLLQLLLSTKVFPAIESAMLNERHAIHIHKKA